jgi:dolichol-phosphate mannosyltransferase
MVKSIISIVVPVYNEEKNLAELWKSINKTVGKLKSYDFEIIFVDDGSKDDSLKEIYKLKKNDKRVKPIELVRNFGKEIATTAGLHFATGDAVIMIDADLQHPVDLIPEFIKKWQAGAEVVTGVRNNAAHESKIKALESYVFYKILNKISDVKIVQNGTDYQLLDRVVVDEFNRLTERNRITRGLISWLGFKTDYLYFDVNARLNGKPTYGMTKLLRLATNSFVSMSLFPLKITGYLGIAISMVAGLLGIFMVIERFVLGDPLDMNFTGTAILATMTLFLVGIILSALGLIALYIGAIHGEVLNRPLFVVRARKDKGDM